MSIILKYKPHEICEYSCPYGERNYPYSGFHYGVDIRGKVHGVAGDPLYAVADGVVRASTVNSGGVNVGYGYYIIVEHDGFCTLYGHLLKLEVKVGQIVKAGQRIATMGNTGSSTGPHLHFEIRKINFANFWNKAYCVDPEPYIKGVTKVSDELTKVEAYKIVQDKTGFADNTMYFLDCYKYAEPLFIKLANAINNASGSSIVLNINVAITILKNKANVSDETINFLKLYIYGEQMIIKLASVMD